MLSDVFMQAEDGIRDCLLSRGLGDVYKRQMYFHPFIDANHRNVLESIQNEINDLIKLSDGIGISRNPLIRVHESTKFEIESVIARCETHKGDIYEF